jgi:hypothetical protein
MCDVTIMLRHHRRLREAIEPPGILKGGLSITVLAGQLATYTSDMESVA